jgi:hypothetical protein
MPLYGSVLGATVELAEMAGITEGNYLRGTAAGDLEERTPAQALADLGGADGSTILLAVRKDSAGTIAKGLPVYLTGWNPSGYATIEQADADDPAKMPAVTILNQAVTNTATVNVPILGGITGMATTGWAEGDSLYVDVDGTMTNVRPVSTLASVQKLGVVLRVHGSMGVIHLVPGALVTHIPNNLDLVPGGALRTSLDAGNTALLQAYDVDGAAYVSFATLTANDTPTMNLAADVTLGGSAIALASHTHLVNVGILVSDPNGDAITTGDDKAVFRVPATLNAWDLTAVAASVTTVSSSGLPTVQIRNATSGMDMLSVALTIDANESDSSTAATAAVINASEDDVATGDSIRIDIDVAGTGAKGLFVSLTFAKP